MENHVHSFVDTVVPATCTQQGYTLHRCDCGYEFKDHFVPMGAHNFETIEQTEPTCFESGSQVQRCTGCGLTRTVGISPRGHAWGDWNMEAVPTCLEAGRKSRICGCCGHKEEEAIAPRGHSLTSPKKSETKKGVIEYFCENCGQTVEMKAPKSKKGLVALTAVVSVILVLAMAALIFMPQIKPAYYYYLAKVQIEMGSYEDAYYNLKHCVKEKEDYKDAQEILDEDFLLVCGEEADYDEDGDLTYKYVETYDDHDKHLKRYRYDSYGEKTLIHESEYDGYGNIFMTADYDSITGELDYKYEYENDYDDEGNITRKKRYRMGEYVGKTEYKYDEDGNVTLEKDYDSDNEYTGKTEYKYDKDGNCTREAYYNANGNLRWKYEYEYDKKGNCTLEASYDENDDLRWKTEYEYDKKGNCTLETEYDENDDLDYKYEYEYDKKGNLILQKYYNEDGDLEEKVEWEYDKKGNCIGIVAYDEDDEKIAEAEYKYDKKGNCIWARYTDYEHREYSSEYEYEYDDRGNVTLEIRYDENGDITSKTKYKDYQVVYLPA